MPMLRLNLIMCHEDDAIMHEVAIMHECIMQPSAEKDASSAGRVITVCIIIS